HAYPRSHLGLSRGTGSCPQARAYLNRAPVWGTVSTVRVRLGSGHAGREVMYHVAAILRGDGSDVVDDGPFGFGPDDDYPTFCLRAAEAVAAGDVGTEHTLGVVLGGSGNGEQMAANKVRGIRTALVWNEQTATLAREHNDAQVASVGARM